MTTRPAPLTGTRILDLTRLLPGPMATLQLAQMGAEIIKIEDIHGDGARGMGPMQNGHSLFFEACNRNKNFIQIDLKQQAAREKFFALVRDADALMEGFRPGVMQRLGLGWDVLRTENPRLVYCAITGYGQDGPYRDRAGHDINYVGYSGILEQNTGRNGRPVTGNFQIGDLLGGAQSAVIGVLAALLDARATGLGRFVDISMTDSVFANNVFPLASVNAGYGSPQPGHALLSGGLPCYNVYRTADQRHMAVGALELKFWQIFCDALNRPDLKPQHWMCGQTEGSVAALALIDELNRIFATRTQADWVAVFDVHDCCVTPILTTEEALEHPLFQARAMVQHQGKWHFAASPIHFSDSTAQYDRPAQPVGADNQRYLEEPASNIAR